MTRGIVSRFNYGISPEHTVNLITYGKIFRGYHVETIKFLWKSITKLWKRNNRRIKKWNKLQRSLKYKIHRKKVMFVNEFLSDFHIIEMMLSFRLVFKLMGANSENTFVQGIYNITYHFVKLFEIIFSRSIVSGSESGWVFLNL